MEGKKLKVVMYPWLALGHMTPFLHLSNKLAENGHIITFILPKKALKQLKPLNLYPSLITFHPITIPHVDPLPLGTETGSDIPIYHHTHLATALDLTRPELECILNVLRPDVVFYDAAYWVPQIAAGLGLGFKSVSYNVVCAAALAIIMVPARKLPTGRALTEDDVAVLPDGYPSKTVVLPPNRLLFVGQPFGEGLNFYDRITGGLKGSDVIAIRTCREVEGKFCDYLSSQYNKPVLLSGPVLPEPDTWSGLEAHWAEWLGQFEPGSVLFCAFGSQSSLEKDQFQELLLAFEMTNLPFLVALKAPKECASIDEALPEGFAERVGERGRVTEAWVQQPLILAHPSVGCFVNHCGFGTMWESLLSDNQIVLVPQLGDQIMNTKIMVGELKVGVEVERGKNNWVSKESLCNAIKCVMDENNEIGNLVKKNHKMWKDMLGDSSFMSGYIDNFIKDIQALVV